MALPLQVDWNLIQSLYLKGLTPKQIGEQMGIKADSVSARAFRYKWSKSRIDSAVMVKAHNDALQEKEPETAGLSKSSARVRSGLAGVLERSIERLEHLSFKTPKAALKANQELESVVRNAKTVFGWSEGQSQPSVRINVLSSFSVEPQAEPQVNSQPVIDATSTPVPLPPSPSE